MTGNSIAAYIDAVKIISLDFKIKTTVATTVLTAGKVRVRIKGSVISKCVGL